MPACPHCSASGLSRDGYDQRGRAIYAGRACGRHATTDSVSLTSGHRFPRDIILLAVRYYLQLGATAERDTLPRHVARVIHQLSEALAA
jgi:transposase-like protein